MQNKVKAMLFSDQTHYKLVEVNENEAEQVREVNRLTWRELKREERKRKQLEKDNIEIISLESSDENQVWISDNTISIEERTIKEENKQDLMTAIERLKPRQRLIVKLVYFEGKSQREVAKILGISEYALSHALKIIYVTLKEYLQENCKF